MPLQKYLELDSTFRNRNLDELPGQFTVTMSQYGIRPQDSAVDPVSNAYPQIIFKPTEYVSSNIRTPFGQNTYIGLFQLLIPPSTPNTLYLTYAINSEQPLLPSITNFFVGLDLVHFSSTNTYPYRRISEWECVQNGANSQIFKVLIDTAFTTILGDPTIAQEFLIPIVHDDSSPLYFLPASLGIPNYYNNFYIQNQTKTFYSTISPPTLLSSPSPQYASIVDFDRDSHYITAGSINSSWKKEDTYAIRKEIPIVTSLLIQNSTSASAVLIGLALVNNLGKQNLINTFFNLIELNSSLKIVNNIRKIIIVEDVFYIEKVTEKKIITDYKLILESPLPKVPQINDKYEILQFSNDNYSPFVYNGTMSSNSQPVAYEIGLNSLSLPNRYLKNGGRIAYYPYVYVTLENVSSTSGNAKNLILSNNPNTYRATFKVPITDLNHPSITPFVKLTGNGMRQTMIFKQNDDMFLKIQLPNGELFETQEEDTADGCAPNPTLQISAVFGMERIQ